MINCQHTLAAIITWHLANL